MATTMKAPSQDEGAKNYQLYCGDSLAILKQLAKDPDHRGKYRAVITSPPYHGDRVYGADAREIGREADESDYLSHLINVFVASKDLLTDDGSIWIVIGDKRKDGVKRMMPARLALALSMILSPDKRFVLRDEIIWYKKNNMCSPMKRGLTPAYESVLWLTKHPTNYVAQVDMIRTLGNEARTGKIKRPPEKDIQKEPVNPNPAEIERLRTICYAATKETPLSALPSTGEISRAHGFEPEKHCPICYRKWKRHVTRKRPGGHSHYPIFTRCHPKGKNPGNVWEIATKAHPGNEHYAIFPEELVEKILNLASDKDDDRILDPFMGRGTTGIVAKAAGRKFTGIDLYKENVKLAEKNITAAVAKR